MTIYVTQEDIDRGIPDSPCQCPVALAIIRTLLGKAVYVENHCFHVNGTQYELPDDAQEFIILFDMGKKVKPFCFKTQPLFTLLYSA